MLWHVAKLLGVVVAGRVGMSRRCRVSGSQTKTQTKNPNQSRSELLADFQRSYANIAHTPCGTRRFPLKVFPAAGSKSLENVK